MTIDFDKIQGLDSLNLDAIEGLDDLDLSGIEGSTKKKTVKKLDAAKYTPEYHGYVAAWNEYADANNAGEPEERVKALREKALKARDITHTKSYIQGFESPTQVQIFETPEARKLGRDVGSPYEDIAGRGVSVLADEFPTLVGKTFAAAGQYTPFLSDKQQQAAAGLSAEISKKGSEAIAVPAKAVPKERSERGTTRSATGLARVRDVEQDIDALPDTEDKKKLSQQMRQEAITNLQQFGYDQSTIDRAKEIQSANQGIGGFGENVGRGLYNIASGLIQLPASFVQMADEDYYQQLKKDLRNKGVSVSEEEWGYLDDLQRRISRATQQEANAIPDVGGMVNQQERERAQKELDTLQKQYDAWMQKNNPQGVKPEASALKALGSASKGMAEVMVGGTAEDYSRLLSEPLSFAKENLPSMMATAADVSAATKFGASAASKGAAKGAQIVAKGASKSAAKAAEKATSAAKAGADAATLAENAAKAELDSTKAVIKAQQQLDAAKGTPKEAAALKAYEDAVKAKQQATAATQSATETQNTRFAEAQKTSDKAAAKQARAERWNKTADVLGQMTTSEGASRVLGRAAETVSDKYNPLSVKQRLQSADKELSKINADVEAKSKAYKKLEADPNADNVAVQSAAQELKAAQRQQFGAQLEKELLQNQATAQKLERDWKDTVAKAKQQGLTAPVKTDGSIPAAAQTVADFFVRNVPSLAWTMQGFISPAAGTAIGRSGIDLLTISKNLRRELALGNVEVEQMVRRLAATPEGVEALRLFNETSEALRPYVEQMAAETSPVTKIPAKAKPEGGETLTQFRARNTSAFDLRNMGLDPTIAQKSLSQAVAQAKTAGTFNAQAFAEHFDALSQQYMDAGGTVAARAGRKATTPKAPKEPAKGAEVFYEARRTFLTDDKLRDYGIDPDVARKKSLPVAIAEAIKQDSQNIDKIDDLRRDLEALRKQVGAKKIDVTGGRLDGQKKLSWQQYRDAELTPEKLKQFGIDPLLAKSHGLDLAYNVAKKQGVLLDDAGFQVLLNELRTKYNATLPPKEISAKELFLEKRDNYFKNNQAELEAKGVDYDVIKDDLRSAVTNLSKDDLLKLNDAMRAIEDEVYKETQRRPVSPREYYNGGIDKTPPTPSLASFILEQITPEVAVKLGILDDVDDPRAQVVPVGKLVKDLQEAAKTDDAAKQKLKRVEEFIAQQKQQYDANYRGDVELDADDVIEIKYDDLARESLAKVKNTLGFIDAADEGTLKSVVANAAKTGVVTIDHLREMANILEDAAKQTNTQRSAEGLASVRLVEDAQRAPDLLSEEVSKILDAEQLKKIHPDLSPSMVAMFGLPTVYDALSTADNFDKAAFKKLIEDAAQKYFTPKESKPTMQQVRRDLFTPEKLQAYGIDEDVAKVSFGEAFAKAFTKMPDDKKAAIVRDLRIVADKAGVQFGESLLSGGLDGAGIKGRNQSWVEYRNERLPPSTLWDVGINPEHATLVGLERAMQIAQDAGTLDKTKLDDVVKSIRAAYEVEYPPDPFGDFTRARADVFNEYADKLKDVKYQPYDNVRKVMSELRKNDELAPIADEIEQKLLALADKHGIDSSRVLVGTLSEEAPPSLNKFVLDNLSLKDMIDAGLVTGSDDKNLALGYGVGSMIADARRDPARAAKLSKFLDSKMLEKLEKQYYETYPSKKPKDDEVKKGFTETFRAQYPDEAAVKSFASQFALDATKGKKLSTVINDAVKRRQQAMSKSAGAKKAAAQIEGAIEAKPKRGRKKQESVAVEDDAPQGPFLTYDLMKQLGDELIALNERTRAEGGKPRDDLSSLTNVQLRESDSGVSPQQAFNNAWTYDKLKNYVDADVDPRLASVFGLKNFVAILHADGKISDQNYARLTSDVRDWFSEYQKANPNAELTNLFGETIDGIKRLYIGKTSVEDLLSNVDAYRPTGAIITPQQANVMFETRSGEILDNLAKDDPRWQVAVDAVEETASPLSGKYKPPVSPEDAAETDFRTLMNRIKYKLPIDMDAVAAKELALAEKAARDALSPLYSSGSLLPAVKPVADVVDDVTAYLGGKYVGKFPPPVKEAKAPKLTDAQKTPEQRVTEAMQGRGGVRTDITSPQRTAMFSDSIAKVLTDDQRTLIQNSSNPNGTIRDVIGELIVEKKLTPFQLDEARKIEKRAIEQTLESAAQTARAQLERALDDIEQWNQRPVGGLTDFPATLQKLIDDKMVTDVEVAKLQQLYDRMNKNDPTVVSQMRVNRADVDESLARSLAAETKKWEKEGVLFVDKDGNPLASPEYLLGIKSMPDADEIDVRLPQSILDEISRRAEKAHPKNADAARQYAEQRIAQLKNDFLGIKRTQMKAVQDGRPRVEPLPADQVALDMPSKQQAEAWFIDTNKRTPKNTIELLEGAMGVISDKQKMEFIKKIQEEYRLLSEDEYRQLPAKYRSLYSKIDEGNKRGLGSLSETYAPKAVANYINFVFETNSSIVSSIKKFVSHWKLTKTAMSVAYYLYNAVAAGIMFPTITAGLGGSPLTQLKAFFVDSTKDLFRLRKILEGKKEIDAASMTAQELPTIMMLMNDVIDKKSIAGEPVYMAGQAGQGLRGAAMYALPNLTEFATVAAEKVKKGLEGSKSVRDALPLIFDSAVGALKGTVDLYSATVDDARIPAINVAARNIDNWSKARIFRVALDDALSRRGMKLQDVATQIKEGKLSLDDFAKSQAVQDAVAMTHNFHFDYSKTPHVWQQLDTLGVLPFFRYGWHAAQLGLRLPTQFRTAYRGLEAGVKAAQTEEEKENLRQRTNALVDEMLRKTGETLNPENALRARGQAEQQNNLDLFSAPIQDAQGRSVRLPRAMREQLGSDKALSSKGLSPLTVWDDLLGLKSRQYSPDTMQRMAGAENDPVAQFLTNLPYQRLGGLPSIITNYATGQTGLGGRMNTADRAIDTAEQFILPSFLYKAMKETSGQGLIDRSDLQTRSGLERAMNVFGLKLQDADPNKNIAQINYSADIVRKWIERDFRQAIQSQPLIATDEELQQRIADIKASNMSQTEQMSAIEAATTQREKYKKALAEYDKQMSALEDIRSTLLTNTRYK